mgnify:CR=1 FL=1|jgi:sulfur carrier protein
MIDLIFMVIFKNYIILLTIMNIYIDKDQTKKEINFTGTVKELLDKLKVNIETVIVVRNNELLNEDEKLINNDNIKILSVVSGG